MIEADKLYSNEIVEANLSRIADLVGESNFKQERLSKEDELFLVKLFQAKNGSNDSAYASEAFELMFEAHKDLIIDRVRKQAGIFPIKSYKGLVEGGKFGLMMAMNKWDDVKGKNNSFITFAFSSIRSGVDEAIGEDLGLKEAYVARMRTFFGKKMRLELTLDEQPSVSEIHDFTQTSHRMIKDYHQTMTRLWIERGTSNDQDEERNQGSFRPVEDQVIYRLQTDKVLAEEWLGEREKDIFKLIIVLGYSRNDVAKDLNITTERVRQIYNKVLIKLSENDL